ncbi:MAG TPA: protoporphyrinogen oxidase [Intrasporangium sp.]|nr:protoporphyrinogen oxidase [Intrasporangium sp.]
MDQLHRRPTVVVVGGGVTGLVAARRLALGGCATTLVEGSHRLGGQVRTIHFAGRSVDVGAEALHLGSPGARALVDELGLAEQVVGARPGTSLLWSSGRLRPLPAGVGPAGPTRLRPVVSSRVMSLRGLGRAGLEPLAAHVTAPLGPDADTSVGGFLETRFGREVADRLVDPLLGSLHAGDIDALSLRACAPSLVGPATERRSLLLRRRSARATPAGPLPSFASFADGLRVLTDQVLADTDVEVRLGREVLALERLGSGYRVHLGDGAELEAEAVVLALPAHRAATILAGSAASLAHRLGQVETASVATVVLALDRPATDDLRAFRANGLLVPSRSGLLLKAMTHLSHKWPHLDDGRTTLLRLSAGRFGDATIEETRDEELVAMLLTELHRLTGLTAEPVAVHVERWPHGMPQQTVGHRARIRSLRDDLVGELPAVVVAGASYDGLGLAACMSSAEDGAALALAHLSHPNHARSLT